MTLQGVGSPSNIYRAFCTAFGLVNHCVGLLLPLVPLIVVNLIEFQDPEWTLCSICLLSDYRSPLCGQVLSQLQTCNVYLSLVSTFDCCLKLQQSFCWLNSSFCPLFDKGMKPCLKFELCFRGVYPLLCLGQQCIIWEKSCRLSLQEYYSKTLFLNGDSHHCIVKL